MGEDEIKRSEPKPRRTTREIGQRGLGLGLGLGLGRCGLVLPATVDRLVSITHDMQLSTVAVPAFVRLIDFR